MARRGLAWSAVDVQKALADLAGEFVASGAAASCVPGAEDIVKCWHETLDMLAKRDLGALAKRCDWALKYLLLDRQRGRRNLTWQAPEIKCLDLIFSSLDPQEGLFWQMAGAGLVEGMPTTEQVERFLNEPPDDTRAYLRAHALRRFGEHIVDMDWDRIRFRLQTERYWWSETALLMPDPTQLGRETSEPILGRTQTLTELIAAVAAEPNPDALNRTGNGSGGGREMTLWGQRLDGWASRPRRHSGYWS